MNFRPQGGIAARSNAFRNFPDVTYIFQDRHRQLFLSRFHGLGYFPEPDLCISEASARFCRQTLQVLELIRTSIPDQHRSRRISCSVKQRSWLQDHFPARPASLVAFCDSPLGRQVLLRNRPPRPLTVASEAGQNPPPALQK
jgi:hypothetical protein